MIETFSERLARLVTEARLSAADLASILETSEMQAKRVLDGTTQSLKLVPALRLCRRLGVSPWYLAGETEQPTMTQPLEDLDADVAYLLEIVSWLQKSQDAIVAALEAHQLKIALPPKPILHRKEHDQ